MLQRGGHQEAAAGQRREAAGDAPGAAEEGAGGNGYAGPYGSAGSKTGAKDKGLSTPPEKDQTIKADAGKPELRLVPWQIVRDIAQIRTYGNRKYHDPDSWRRVELDRYIDALLRHVIAFAEDPAGKDAESGIEHYKHAACNLAFIAELMKGDNHG